MVETAVRVKCQGTLMWSWVWGWGWYTNIVVLGCFYKGIGTSKDVGCHNIFSKF